MPPLQVCSPVQVLTKMTSTAGAVTPPALKKLTRCLASIKEIAAAAGKLRLEDAAQEMLTFLDAWFDVEGNNSFGIVRPGIAELDTLKEQFAALPVLLQQVRLPIRGLRLKGQSRLGDVG